MSGLSAVKKFGMLRCSCRCVWVSAARKKHADDNSLRIHEHLIVIVRPFIFHVHGQLPCMGLLKYAISYRTFLRLELQQLLRWGHVINHAHTYINACLRLSVS